MEKDIIKNIDFVSPIYFAKGGSNFRYEILKMAFECTKNKSSVERLMLEATKLLDWVNEKCNGIEFEPPKETKNPTIK